MRFISFVLGAALAMTAGIAVAQTQPAKESASQGAAVAPAAMSKAKSRKYSSGSTTMATLLGDPAAKAVLEKYVPDLIKSDHIEQMSGMTLKDVQQAVGQYAPDLLSDKKLALIDQDLAALPVKK